MSGALPGVDAGPATVQMPPGVPVATLGIGPAGGRNAAYLAARHPGVRTELHRATTGAHDRVLHAEHPQI